MEICYECCVGNFYLYLVKYKMGISIYKAIV